MSDRYYRDEYKEGRGDYYLAEGKRAERADTPAVAASDLPVGAIVASALFAANIACDSGEDVDRFLRALQERGFDVQAIGAFEDGLAAAKVRLSLAGLHDGNCPEPEKPCVCGLDAAVDGYESKDGAFHG